MLRGMPPEKAFTLIEIMMVVGLLGIMFTVAIPAFARAHNQRPMKVATEELMELLNTARAQAIVRGVTVELRVDPQDYTFDVVPTNSGSRGERRGGGGLESRGRFHVKLPDDVGIELLAVNFQLLKDAEAAVAKFYANGTCEEFTVVIRSIEGEFRKISVEPITSRADFEVIR
jgi:prepilin-type N-terminal cleavage/methylation domain-containing protein